MFTKWVIDHKELRDYRFDSNEDLYRLPFTKKNRSYGFRKLKMQEKNRWRLNNSWWSISQLEHLIKIDNNPIKITEKIKIPF